MNTRSIIEFFPDLSLLIMALTVWTASYHFAEMLHRSSHRNALKISNFAANTQSVPSSSDKVSWKEIYNLYKCLSELCENINHAFGSMVTLYLAAMLLYQASRIDEIIIQPNVGSKVQAILYSIIFISFLLLSADACGKVL